MMAFGSTTARTNGSTRVTEKILAPIFCFSTTVPPRSTLSESRACILKRAKIFNGAFLTQEHRINIHDAECEKRPADSRFLARHYVVRPLDLLPRIPSSQT